MSNPDIEQTSPATLRGAEAGSAHTARLAVAVHGASKTYPNGLRALESIDLEVREGDFATLLGPSGCGKSTLLRMIGGLSAPTAGSVILESGSEPPEASGGHAAQYNRGPAARARANASTLAFVFQNPTLMPWASVERNVRLPLDLASVEDQREPKVAAALALVGLSEFAKVYPRELSGGMQMRVSIARALLTEPRLLLMDEPFGALDEITRYRLDRDIRDLWARHSLTVVFVTHSIFEAVYLSTRVLVMSARPGRIIGEFVVGEPHPRTDAFRVSGRYARWCKRLSEMLAAGGDEAGGARPLSAS